MESAKRSSPSCFDNEFRPEKIASAVLLDVTRLMEFGSFLPVKEDLRGAVDFTIRGDVAVYRTSFSRRPRAWILPRRNDERIGRGRATGCSTLANFCLLFPPAFPIADELIRLVCTSVARARARKLG